MAFLANRCLGSDGPDLVVSSKFDSCHRRPYYGKIFLQSLNWTKMLIRLELKKKMLILRSGVKCCVQEAGMMNVC